jgi:hypothetical protein
MPLCTVSRADRLPGSCRPDWATFSPAFCGSSSSIFWAWGAFFRAFVPAAKALSRAYEEGSRACSPSSKPRSWHRC